MATHEAGSWENFQGKIPVDQETGLGSEMDPNGIKTVGSYLITVGKITPVIESHQVSTLVKTSPSQGLRRAKTTLKYHIKSGEIPVKSNQM